MLRDTQLVEAPLYKPPRSSFCPEEVRHRAPPPRNCPARGSGSMNTKRPASYNTDANLEGFLNRVLGNRETDSTVLVGRA
jgi:hypothetical protein